MRTNGMRGFFAALLLLGCATGATAQEQERPVKEPRVRFGVGYRYSFALTESYGAKTPVLTQSNWDTPYRRRGGMLQLEGTVRITPHWNAGIGFGFAGFSGNDTFALYGKGERLYGTRPRRSRWFNYAQLGITAYPDNGLGGIAALGGGYRLGITRRTRMDFTLGLEWAHIVGGAYAYIAEEDDIRYYPRGGRYHRIGLTLGTAMHF